MGQQGNPDQRRSARVPAQKPVSFSWKEVDTEQRRTTLSFALSRFGCGLYSLRFFKPGTRLMVSYGGKTIEGAVAYCQENRPAELFEVGVGFDRDGHDFWDVEIP